MKTLEIALIGATGFVGSKVLAEALRRGHAVTALVRDPSRLEAQAGLKTVTVDVTDPAALAAALEGQDALVSAFNGPRGAADYAERFLGGSVAILDGVKRAGLKRVLVVGGAGSLEVAPGVMLKDTPHFPAAYKLEADTAAEVLSRVKAETTLDWSFISPAPLLGPGERTGQFRLGGDTVLMKDGQPGSISVDDLAVAIIDEIERGEHIRRRFTLAY